MDKAAVMAGAAVAGILLVLSIPVLKSALRPKTMPAFELQTESGKPFTNRDISGRVALFYFSGEGCGACEAAAPEITRIQDSYPKKRVAVVAGDAWHGSKSAAGTLGRKLGFPALTGMDRLRRRFGGATVPYFVVVDRSGKVVFTQSGFGSGQPIEDAIHRALESRPGNLQ